MTAIIIPRTPDQIIARINAFTDDVFGFRAEVLVFKLDYDHAKPWLKDTTTAEEFGEPALDVDLVRAEAAAYLDFAFGKAADHRGISASRSVQKLEEWAWLLGRDDVLAAMDAAGYVQYGVPKLIAFAAGMGLPVPDDPALARMADGEPCRPGCDWGCGT